MAKNSKIEWTEASWNPFTGCSKISEGCKNCYAEKLTYRLWKMKMKKYCFGWNSRVYHKEYFSEPLDWKKPQMIFVCSMSDIFHSDFEDEIVLELFKTMNKANWHTFQVLTKRPERLSKLSEKINWTDNIWMGVTIESQQHIDRLDYLLESKAKIKYLSIEPMLSEIELPKDKIKNINWIIVGGESGIGAREMKIEWARKIRDVCVANNIPFFFKQWGGVNKKKSGRLLDGVEWNQMPKI